MILIQLTKDKRFFIKLAEFGKRLADLHLMQSPELDFPIAKFQGTGGKRVEKIKYDKKRLRVYINNHIVELPFFLPNFKKSFEYDLTIDDKTYFINNRHYLYPLQREGRKSWFRKVFKAS